ncbi:hypothetical protein H1220_07525 [Carnobacteriaceae bacterium zg-84]|uniref:hypothetical protein n=1 Tax=Granulicatella sp. zg-84 TaxID=2678503 RepID=UPI0013C1198D|nr:hypothetical protein [Granulicatella sp. zg-84]NEW65588.1 hypothetical protein [Granulicatella sp. zg-84]QMI85533.1 hypothetical protein H1220_07525 [Carnobacteriaceae bacterium zg-84]
MVYHAPSKFLLKQIFYGMSVIFVYLFTLLIVAFPFPLKSVSTTSITVLLIASATMIKYYSFFLTNQFTRKQIYISFCTTFCIMACMMYAQNLIFEQLAFSLHKLSPYESALSFYNTFGFLDKVFYIGLGILMTQIGMLIGLLYLKFNKKIVVIIAVILWFTLPVSLEILMYFFKESIVILVIRLTGFQNGAFHAFNLVEIVFGLIACFMFINAAINKKIVMK